MKNYYIDRYIMLYNKGKLIQTEKADRWQTPDENSGIQFIASQNPRYIENKNGFSMYESFIMVTKNEGGQYKRIIKEATPDGMISNV